MNPSDFVCTKFWSIVIFIHFLLIKLIRIGAHEIDTSGSLYDVEKVWAHENYRPYQRYNDISVFKLSAPVKNEKALAACNHKIFLFFFILKKKI